MKFGLIGYPIEHSLSPALFKAGYNGRYPYELIEADDFDKAYSRFLKEYDGINVTAPFKELAIRKADILSEECRIIGATNLLIKTPEGIKAYNSDYLGVRLWLSEAYQGVESVLIVGIGGAGKAAAAAARSLGMEVCVLNRTRYDETIKPLDCFREEFRKADIVIYNLPVRIAEMDTLTDEDFGRGKPKYILEANYRNPSFDKELIQTMQRTNPAVTYTEGRVWLLLQAVTGYKILTGENPDERAMEEIIKSK